MYVARARADTWRNPLPPPVCVSLPICPNLFCQASRRPGSGIPSLAIGAWLACLVHTRIRGVLPTDRHVDDPSRFPHPSIRILSAHVPPAIATVPYIRCPTAQLYVLSYLRVSIPMLCPHWPPRYLHMFVGRGGRRSSRQRRQASLPHRHKSPMALCRSRPCQDRIGLYLLASEAPLHL